MKTKRRSVSIVQPYASTYRRSFFADLTEELSQHGVDLTIYTGRASGLERFRRDSAHDPIFRQVHQRAVRLAKKELVIRFLPLRLWRSDLIIMEQATRNMDSFLVTALRPVLRYRIAFWGHGRTITQRQSRLEYGLQRWLTKRSDWFFAYTQASAQRAVKIGAHPAKMSVLNNTFDTRALRESMSRSNNDQFVDPGETWSAIYIGAIDRSKKIDELIDIGTTVHATDSRFRLIVAGSGADEDLLKTADHPWLTYIGRVDETQKARLAKIAKIMLVPGRVGLVAIDSFVMGVPIVTSPWEFHAPEFEYLNHSNSMVVDSDVIADSIVRLMRNPDELERLRAGASASAAEYSHEHMVESFASGVRSAMVADQ